jgi:putative ABC transport system permease protein
VTRALRFACRSLVRQPARALLGVLGVAAVGALLFDMLMLSNGLLVSMRDLLDRTGFDVRVTTGGDALRGGARMAQASAAAAGLLHVPTVNAAMALRLADGSIDRASGGSLRTSIEGVTGSGRLPWTMLRGRDLPERISKRPDVVVDTALADALRLAPENELALRVACQSGVEIVPEVTVRVVGVAEFPLGGLDEHTVGMRMEALDDICGVSGRDEAEVILVTSTGDAEVTAGAIARACPDVRAQTNGEIIGRFQDAGFTYFRQISTVLTVVTLSFAVLLITVLLTVSVNQRLGEIAALRALGLSRGRVVADVLCESVLIVGTGGLLSIPVGAMLAEALDRILKVMPGIPVDLHFFVFERQALLLHVLLLGATAAAAALYPMRIVARLPIAATLRKEVSS